MVNLEHFFGLAESGGDRRRRARKHGPFGIVRSENHTKVLLRRRPVSCLLYKFLHVAANLIANRLVVSLAPNRVSSSKIAKMSCGQ